MGAPYSNRKLAGQELAERLRTLRDRDPLVLALPRGGVPVAFEVAEALQAPLDLLLVRKLGVPGQEELAFGAVASGGARVINEEVVNAAGITQDKIDEVTERERRELQRRAQAYRGDAPESDVSGRNVIVIDDGLATGATMRAGMAALRERQPVSIVAAVPVGPLDSVKALAEDADDVVCPATPDTFRAIGQWYRDFTQVSDNTVRELLQRNWRGAAAQREGER